MQNLKNSNNLLFWLQIKKFWWLRNSARAMVKLPFLLTPRTYSFSSYLEFPLTSWKIIWQKLTSGIFFGLGLHGYYNLDLSKKQRLTTRNNYVSKLQIKKDSRFFYGVIIARKLNFLNSTITLRNVFYNEVMEKTFPVFSIRNTLVGPILKNRLRHFLSPYLWNKRYKKKFYYLRNYPWAVNRIVLID